MKTEVAVTDIHHPNVKNVYDAYKVASGHQATIAMMSNR